MDTEELFVIATKNLDEAKECAKDNDTKFALLYAEMSQAASLIIIAKSLEMIYRFGLPLSKDAKLK